MTRVGSVGAKAITTIEGLTPNGASKDAPDASDRLHPVQQAFLDVEAFQCGYCTSGMVMAAVGLLKTNAEPLGARHRAPDGSQRLPLRHLPAHRQGGAPGGGADAARPRPRSEESNGASSFDSFRRAERYELSEARRYTFELERRDFMRLFGGGLVVMVAAADALAQESGRARPQGRGDTPDLAAWLHIDETGRVQVCTGKVEIGQNIRTSLAQTVADELRVPIASITMVMADTDEDAVRHGDVRIADDAADGAAAGEGGGDRARDADRSGRGAVEGRSRHADRARRPDRRRRRPQRSPTAS